MGDESFDGLILPPVEPWAEPVNGRALLDGSKRWVTRFVILPRWVAETVVLWNLHTYAFEEVCEYFQEDDVTMARLRAQCARFVQDNAEAIAAARPVLPKGLSDRAAQIWEPLVILADLAGGDWPEAARQAAVALSAKAGEDNPMSALLFGIWLSFRVAGGERIFSRMLVDGLNSMEDQRWGTMRSGKGITVEWLANQLERHGIRPRTIRIGEKQAKGYYGEDFKEAFQRYMSPSDKQKLARIESALASTPPPSRCFGEASRRDKSAFVTRIRRDRGRREGARDRRSEVRSAFVRLRRDKGQRTEEG